jgi:two-component system, OmpR family, response regulator VicR
VMRSMSLEVIRLSGMEACLYSGQYRPELVTLDLSLEGVNGIELIEQIRFGCRPQPKILVITDSMPSLVSKARIAGADAILNKPFDNDALRRNVRILLGLD